MRTYCTRLKDYVLLVTKFCAVFELVIGGNVTTMMCSYSYIMKEFICCGIFFIVTLCENLYDSFIISIQVYFSIIVLS